MAHASFLSSLASIFIGGEKAQAKEIDIQAEDEVMGNSQTIALLESSIDPDMKNMKDTPTLLIVEDEALSPTDIFTGSGLENISSGGIIVYKVKKGDTLSEIAEQYDISTNTIRWENNISGQKIRIGQKLNILPVTGVKHIVKKGDNLGKIASKYDANLEDTLIFNGISKESKINIGDILFVPNGVIKKVVSSKRYVSNTSVSNSIKGYFIKPIVGRVTSNFGPRKGGFHYGIDYGAKRGTPVVAAASGKVIKIVNYCVEGKTRCGGRYGNYIVIKHPNGTNTRYAHLGKVLVFTGQNVNQDQLIAKSGNTGHTTGPHLHFEIEKSNGSKIRPRF